MQTYRDRIGKVVEDGERLEAAVRNGLPPEDAIKVLTDMAQEANDAERRLKELGIYNLDYRVSKEYLLDMSKIRSARMAILRRILAVENIAATGQGALDIEGLLFEIEQLNKEKTEDVVWNFNNRNRTNNL